MILIINKKECEYNELNLDISINNICRKFIYTDIDNSKRFNNNDKVVIKSYKGITLFEGIIEQIYVENKKYIYVGRNRTRLLSDNYTSDVINFNNSTFNSLLSKLIKSDIKINVKTGSILIPTEINRIIPIATNIGSYIMNLAKELGVIILNDSYGNISIEKEPYYNKEITFEYGYNIDSREYVNNNSLIYDKYMCISQDNFLDGEGIYNKHILGAGDKIKVIDLGYGYSENHCKKMCEIEKIRDMRSALSYIMSIAGVVDVKINNKYSIKDDNLNINEALRVKRVNYISSNNNVNSIIHLGY